MLLAWDPEQEVLPANDCHEFDMEYKSVQGEHTCSYFKTWPSLFMFRLTTAYSVGKLSRTHLTFANAPF